MKEEESALSRAAKLACDEWDENLHELTLVESLNSELNGFNSASINDTKAGIIEMLS